MNARALLVSGGILVLGLLCAGRFVIGPHTDSPDINEVDHREKARCPVCGMFVARYEAWLGQIRFRDGELVSFDGAKDLFRFYFDVQRYAPGKTTNQIQSLQVTEYYSARQVDGYQCRYVIGSDVLGPMGHELIPFATDQAAREFLRDHHGRRMLTFGEVTRETVAHLE